MVHQRGRGAKRKTSERTQFALCLEHQDLRQQGAMHNQTVIAFDIAGMGQIIMDAMAIERQRRITKQQR